MKKNGAKKSKKKVVLIVIAVVLAIIAGLLTVGYYAVEKAFSVLTNSLYQSSSMQEEVTLEENKSSGTLPGEPGATNGTGGDTDGQTGGADSGGAKSADNSALEAARKKLGVSGSMKFSAEKLKELEKSVSMGDKLAVMAIIGRALSPEDYQTLLAMTGGGITQEEIGRAYSILSKSLSTEDKSKIYEYYAKYAYLLQDN